MTKPKEQKKRPYEKPELRRIGLVADEVLAAGCKLGNQAAPRRQLPRHSLFQTRLVAENVPTRSHGLPGAVYARTPDIVPRQIAGDTILVAVRGELARLERIFVLNTVGEYVWAVLDGKKTVATWPGGPARPSTSTSRPLWRMWPTFFRPRGCGVGLGCPLRQMSGAFTLAIPGIRFELQTLPRDRDRGGHPLYREFVGHTETAPRTRWGSGRGSGWDPAIDSREKRFRHRRQLACPPRGRRPRSCLPFTHPPGAFWWTARFAPGETEVQVTCDPEMIARTPAVTRIANPIHDPLDQILTMFLLAERGGCIVHAAGVERGGRGVACIGRSGAGKTTLMGLLEGRTDLDRLSDDRLILRVGEPPSISGTPWAGEGMVAANDTAGLTALIFLHQGPDHDLQPIAPREAAAQLLPTTSIPWLDGPPR